MFLRQLGPGLHQGLKTEKKYDNLKIQVYLPRFE